MFLEDLHEGMIRGQVFLKPGIDFKACSRQQQRETDHQEGADHQWPMLKQHRFRQVQPAVPCHGWSARPLLPATFFGGEGV